MERNVHNIEKRLKSCERSIEKSTSISESDKELIFKFRDHCYSEDLTKTRILFYLLRLKKITEFAEKDLKDLEKEDIKKIVALINRRYKSEWTKHGFRVTLKKFYKWLEGDGEEYPDKVKWLKTSTKNDKNGLPEILTKEEVKKIISCASKIRDKALISFLYESGCRVSELLNIKIGDMEFDDYGVRVKVVGKTGERIIRLVGCIPHLNLWLEHHPHKDKNSYLWVSVGQKNSGKRITYQTVAKLVKKLAEKAGIEKKIHPHTFRHTRATHMASDGRINNAIMCQYFGWSQNSDMPSVYFHLSGEDVDRAILQMYGLHKEKEEETFQLLKCGRCGEDNPPEVDYCRRCRAPLTQKAITESMDFLERMIQEKIWELQAKGFIKSNQT